MELLEETLLREQQEAEAAAAAGTGESSATEQKEGAPGTGEPSGVPETVTLSAEELAQLRRDAEAFRAAQAAGTGTPQPKTEAPPAEGAEDFADLRALSPEQVEAKLLETKDPAESLKIKRFQNLYASETSALAEFETRLAEPLKDPIVHGAINASVIHAQEQLGMSFPAALAYAEEQAKARGLIPGGKPKEEPLPDLEKRTEVTGPPGVGRIPSDMLARHTASVAASDIERLATSNPAAAEAAYHELVQSGREEEWLRGGLDNL